MMIKNSGILRRLEDEFIRSEGRLAYSHSLQVFTEMWKEARRFGVLPPKDPLEGIDTDIRVARVLNSCLKRSSQG